MSTKIISFSCLIFFILLFISCCQSRISKNSSCPPSSCGNLNNISFPFHFKGDPNNCGNPNYELDCQNNQTFIFFNSKKFFLQSINYNNYTIRVVDPGLVNPTTNCSFPIYSATNFYDDSIEYYFKRKLISLQYEYNLPIVFLSCVKPISYSSSTRFIDISFCRGSQNTSGQFLNPSRTSEYIGVLNYNTQIWELPETCGVEEVAFSSANGPLSMEKNSSLADIYQGLGYGFELSWVQVKCEKCQQGHGYCILEDNNVVNCKHCPPPPVNAHVHVDVSSYCSLKGSIEYYASFVIAFGILAIGRNVWYTLILALAFEFPVNIGPTVATGSKVYYWLCVLDGTGGTYMEKAAPIRR